MNAKSVQKCDGCDSVSLNSAILFYFHFYTYQVQKKGSFYISKKKKTSSVYFPF